MNQQVAIERAIKTITESCAIQNKIDAGHDEQQLIDELKDRFATMWTKAHEESYSADWMLVSATEYAKRISHREIERYLTRISGDAEGDTLMTDNITGLIFDPVGGVEIYNDVTYRNITEFRNYLKGRKFYFIE